MAQQIPSFEAYVASLGPLTAHVDPTLESEQGLLIKKAAAELAELDDLNADSLAKWVYSHPDAVGVLGLVAGLSQEKLMNHLRHGMGSSGYKRLALQSPMELIEFLDNEFSLLALLESQRQRTYDFGDVLVARAGTRALAVRAGQAGRKLEDEVEAIARRVGLPYVLRGRFEGRNGLTAPFDLAVPSDGIDAQIVVAAKAFDSTGSKLTDAVREIEEMAANRLPRQFVFAVIDGIGWKSRAADLRRIHNLWTSNQIEGMYTLASLGEFQEDLADAARRLGLTNS